MAIGHEVVRPGYICSIRATKQIALIFLSALPIAGSNGNSCLRE